MADPGPPLHPLLEPLAWLLGEWHGAGGGRYPSLDPFEFRMELSGSHLGTPRLVLIQRTWRLDGDAPGTASHLEAGYLRVGDDGLLEFLVATGSGIAEQAEGRLEGMRLTLLSRQAVMAPSAARVDAVRRIWELDGDVLRYEVDMAALGEPMQFHLAAQLRRLG